MKKKSILFAAISAAFAMDAAVTVTVDSIRQNWPWSAEVLVGFTLSGLTGEMVDIEVEAFSGTRSLGKLLPTGDCLNLTENKPYVLKVNPKVAASNPLVADFKVRLQPVASDPSWDAPLYLVYDLTQEDAEVEIVTPAKILAGAYGDYQWSCNMPVLEPGKPVAYTNLVWTGVNQDKYKDNFLVMRYLPAEGETVNICCFTDSAYTMPDNYYVGVFETTQKQWNRVMGEYPVCTHSGSQNHRPVETVTYMAVRGHVEDNYWPNPPAKDSFLDKLRAKTGGAPFDLPAAYQLTYAAQAGNNFKIAATKFDSATWPDNMPTVTYVDGVAVTNPAPGRYNAHSTCSVGSFAPSSQGIYDIVGNVSEMCIDWNYGSQGAQRKLRAIANVDTSNPSKALAESSSGSNRHYTGSDYSVDVISRHSLNYARGSVTPGTGSKTIGFRLFLPEAVNGVVERKKLTEAVADESAVCAVVVKPEETAFWRTASNSTFEVFWEFPSSAGKATLSVVGMGSEYTFADLTEKRIMLELPPPVAAEDVYELALAFDDDSVQRCSLAVVRGAREDAAATIDYASDSDLAWRRTKPRAVFPVPFGAERITVDGKDYALDGSAGWFGYVYPAGVAVSEVSLHAGGSVFGNSLIPACGLVLTVR